jgi:hypothetical protein
MNAKDLETINTILRHPQLSHADHRCVEMLGNEAFDYLKEVLSKPTKARTSLNGLRLLMRLSRQAAQDSSGLRLPEVFDVASHFVIDPDLDVRTIAARAAVWALTTLKRFGRSLDELGGVARATAVIQSFLSADLKSVERGMLEDALAQIEAR